MMKLTQKLAIEIAISALTANPNKEYRLAGYDDEATGSKCIFTADEAIEKLTAMAVQLDKKASAPKKPTAKQTENEKLMEDIALALADADAPMTISDMIAKFSCCEGMSNQKVATIVRKMVDNGTVVREEVKRKAYFKVAQQG